MEGVVWKHNYVVGLVTGGNLKGSSAMGMFISKIYKDSSEENEGKIWGGVKKLIW